MKSHDLTFVNEQGGVHCSQCDTYWGRMDPISTVCEPKPLLVDQNEREGMGGFSFSETPDSVAEAEVPDVSKNYIWPPVEHFDGETPDAKWESLPHNPCGDLLIGSANQYAPESFDDGGEIKVGVDPGVDPVHNGISFYFSARKPFDMDRFWTVPSDGLPEMPFTWKWDGPLIPEPEPEVPQWKRNRDAMDARFERRRQEAETRDDACDKLDQAEKDFGAAIQAFKIFKEYLEKSAVSWDEFIEAYDNLPDTEEN